MGHTLLTDYYPTKLGEAVVPPAAAIPPLPPRNKSSKTSNRWPVAFSTRSTATVAMLLWMCRLPALSGQQLHGPRRCMAFSHGHAVLIARHLRLKGSPTPHGLLLDPCTESWRFTVAMSACHGRSPGPPTLSLHDESILLIHSSLHAVPVLPHLTVNQFKMSALNLSCHFAFASFVSMSTMACSSLTETYEFPNLLVTMSSKLERLFIARALRLSLSTCRLLHPSFQA